MQVIVKLKLSVNFLSSQFHPLIHSKSSIIPRVVLLKQGLVLILRRKYEHYELIINHRTYRFRMRKAVLLGDSQELIHHLWELSQFDNAVLVCIVISEDLQHVPVEFHLLRTRVGTNGGLDELLVLVHTTMVNDGMRVHGSSLGSDVLLAELQPFIKGDDTSGLEIHGVKHLLSGSILLCLSLVQLRVLWSKTICSWHRCSSINQLGERCLTDKTITVGVGINEQLQERMIQL